MATQKTDPIFDYVARAKQAEESSKQAQINVANILSQQEEFGKEVEIQTAAAGKSRQAVVAGEEAINAAVDAQKAAIVDNYGTDYTKQGSDALRWSQEAKVNRDAAYEAEKQLREAQKVDFMSNPLGFISAQFEIPTLAAQYNYHAGLTNSAEANLTSITQASNSAVNAAVQAKRSTSANLAIAKGEEAAALNAAQVAEIKSKNAGLRIKGIEELNALSSRDLDRVFQVHQMQNSDASLQLQREAADRARKESAERLEMKNAQLDQVKYEMEAYNAGARRTGKMTFSDPKMFLKAYESNKNLPEFINTLTSGKMLVLNDGVNNGIMVADNAGEASMLYATGQATTPIARMMKSQVMVEKQNVAAPKDRQGFAGHMTTRLTDIANTQLKSIDQTGPTENIYAAPPASIMLQAKSLDSPFMNSVIRPLVESEPTGKINDAVIVSSALQYAKTSPANFNDAATSIVNYYRKAVLQNNAVNQYTENGLPAQKNYRARVDGKIVDLTDPVQVKRHLLTEQLKQSGVNPIAGFTSGM